MSRPLEEDDGAVSPRASKKPRLESEPGDLPIQPQQPTLADQGAGNQIEEELASALGPSVVDTVERQDDKPSHIETPVENAVAPEANQDIDTDIATVISSIMNHAERVEEQCVIGQQQLVDTSGQSAPKGMVFVKANSHLKIQSLPILDNLVRQFSESRFFV
jgi:hypothetical protein